MSSELNFLSFLQNFAFENIFKDNKHEYVDDVNLNLVNPKENRSITKIISVFANDVLQKLLQPHTALVSFK